MNVNAAALVACVWLMDPTAADLFLRDVVENRLKVPESDPKPMALNRLDAEGRMIGVSAMGSYGDPTQLPAVAVIRIEDVLTPWYADWKADQLRRAYQDDSVLGAVVLMNCIGGVDQAAYLLTDVLAERNKPVVFYCQYGQMNSSAYWTACGGDYLMSSRATDRIGGIGIYIPFLDSTGYFTASGYAKRDIYAPESTEKNAEFRQAQKGNDKPMEQWASEIRGNFENYVRAQRGNRLKEKAGDPFKGATYNATDALAIGLIDEIGTFERAVEKCVELSLVGDDSGARASAPATGSVAASNVTTPNDTNMQVLGFLKLAALAALKGLEPSAITPEQVNAVNEELKANGFGGLAVISESELTTAVQASGQVTALTNELTTAKTALATAEAKVAAYGSQPGAEPTEPKGASDPAPVATGQPSAAEVIAQLPHSVALANNPWFKE